ncbi:MAG: hypothetical protein J0M30_05950 [Chitinophagales bacterium]|nr:hypothetical protein [Chitinophagales bacterium]
MKLRPIYFLITLFLGLSSLTFAQTADEVINKHVEAIGGADAWRKVTSLRQEGSMTVQGTDVQLVLTVVKDKGSRQDISITAMGMSGYQIITPTEGWNYMPFNGMMAPEAMTADELTKSQDDLDPAGPLLDYQAKGHKVELLGKEDVEGVECFKIKVDTKNGSTQTFYLDPSTYYIIRVVSKQDVNGQEVEVPTGFANYEKLPEGIVIAKSITLPFGEMTITNVDVNKPIEDSVFKKPS